MPKNRLRSGCFAFAALSLATCVARAQSNDAELVRQLLKEIHDLQSRVGDLERRSPASAVPVPVASDSVPPAVEVPMPEKVEESAMHAGHGFLASPQLTFHGYADLGYRATTSSGGNSGFALGQADFFVTSKLSDRFSFLLELAVDSDLQNVPGAEIERMFLTYRQSEYFNIDVGRYHTAIGYFNAAFHHGRWFQTAADRPFLFLFEDQGGILPIHNVGVSVTGKIPSGALGLHYAAEIGNGRAYKNADVAPVQVTTVEHNGKALNFALYANPRGLPGAQFGASWYRDRLTPDDLPKIEQSIYSAHAIYVRDRIEFLNEVVLMRHTRNLFGTNRVTNVPAFYTQLSYRMGTLWRPYVRYEFMNPAASDPVVPASLLEAGHRRSFTGGVRYDLSEFCALKFQLEHLRRRDLSPATEGSVQLSFAF